MNVLELRRRTLGKGVYKKTVEGNPAIAQGSLARRYPGITMQGWTEQDGTPTPEAPVPIVSAGTQNQDAGKWEYEVKLTGKNLLPYGEGDIKIGIPYEIRGRTYILNKDGSITITTQGSSESSTGNIFIFGAVGDRKHYKLPAGKYTVSTFNGNIPNMSIQLEDENGVNTRSVSVGKFELKEHERIAYAWLYGAAGTEWNGTIYPQLEYGGVSTSYEQYKLPQTVTLTSDLPLTKWDKLEKRNGQWGWGYKSAEIESYTDESVPGEYYSTTGQLSVGAQVWYETATKTFVPLSPEEQKQMNALHTFRPTTVLSNDCGCNMELTYKTKKSLEVTD